MPRVLGPLGMLLLAGSPSAAAPSPSAPAARTFDLCATVTRPPSLPTASDATKQVWPVGSDPRYLVELRLLTLVGTAPFAAGDVVRFLIHSPARTFGETPRRNERVCLRAHVQATATTTTFLVLERRPS